MPENAACATIATPLWDSRFRALPPESAGYCDFAIASDGEETNRGGFSATSPLETAILHCLFTDRRRPLELESPDGSAHRRGWAGDSFDIEPENGEREMGSLLWTLDRGVLDYDTARRAESYATEALQTLIDQGHVSEFRVEAVADRARAMLVLTVVALAPTGVELFANTYPVA